MDRGAAVLLMAMVGGLIAAQPAINSTLGRATGSIAAAFISFLVGTIALGVIVVVSGEWAGLDRASEVQPIYLIGGLLGAVYIFASLVLVRQIGAGGVAAATITGQLGFAVVLDRFGAFGLDQEPITPERVLGVGLLLVGTLLVVR